MIGCDDIRPQLTAYLEGELDGDPGSVVRGHLRGCAACRDVARDEAALRDGLRSLPSVDVPPALWAGVQARLAAAEVADAGRPSWRRALARWTPSVRRLAPTFGAVSLAAAAAASLLVWRAHRSDDVTLPLPAPPAVAVTVPVPTLAPDGAPTPTIAPSDDDVTADLARESERTTAAYATAADRLVSRLADVRASWPEERRHQFDARLAELRAAVAAAGDGHPRQRAWRAVNRYLEGALVRDEVASNDRVLAAPMGGPGRGP